MDGCNGGVDGGLLRLAIKAPQPVFTTSFIFR